MNIRRAVRCAGLSLLVCAMASRAGAQAYKNAALPVDARVRDLLGRMTLEEKFWQLWMVPGDLDSGTTVYRHGVFGLQVRERVRRGRAIARSGRRGAAHGRAN